MGSELIDAVYLPFTREELLEHFAPVAGDEGESEIQRRLQYYLESADRYHEFLKSSASRKGLPLTVTRKPCQIEKDERFWVAACLMGVFHSPERGRAFTMLFDRAFGKSPPLPGLQTWEECLRGRLHLFFEVSLPSPPAYKDWLARNVRERHLIPYVLDAAHKRGGKEIKKGLEGPTHLDAMLLNEDNGFAAFWEAKVLSDISHDVSFDIARNQIARNIDVMLEANPDMPCPLSRRVPERSLFVLLTPEFFRKNPSTRHYGSLLPDYQKNPDALVRDLPHRPGADWSALSHRIGWLTFEDCHQLVPGACPWFRR